MVEAEGVGTVRRQAMSRLHESPWPGGTGPRGVRRPRPLPDGHWHPDGADAGLRRRAGCGEAARGAWGRRYREVTASGWPERPSSAREEKTSAAVAVGTPLPTVLGSRPCLHHRPAGGDRRRRRHLTDLSCSAPFIAGSWLPLVPRPWGAAGLRRCCWWWSPRFHRRCGLGAPELAHGRNSHGQSDTVTRALPGAGALSFGPARGPGTWSPPVGPALSHSSGALNVGARTSWLSRVPVLHHEARDHRPGPGRAPAGSSPRRRPGPLIGPGDRQPRTVSKEVAGLGGLAGGWRCRGGGPAPPRA